MYSQEIPEKSDVNVLVIIYWAFSYNFRCNFLF